MTYIFPMKGHQLYKPEMITQLEQEGQWTPESRSQLDTVTGEKQDQWKRVLLKCSVVSVLWDGKDV